MLRWLPLMRRVLLPLSISCFSLLLSSPPGPSPVLGVVSVPVKCRHSARAYQAGSLGSGTMSTLRFLVACRSQMACAAAFMLTIKAVTAAPRVLLLM